MFTGFGPVDGRLDCPIAPKYIHEDDTTMRSPTVPIYSTATEVLTLPAVLDRSAENWPDREFLAFKEGRATFRQIRERADEIARSLIGLGVEPGEHVGILMDDGLDYAAAIFAVAKAGAVVVTLNARSKSVELTHSLEHSDIVVLLTASDGTDFAARLVEVLPGLDAADPGRLVLDAAPTLRMMIMLGSNGTPAGFISEDWLRAAREDVSIDQVHLRQAAVNPDDVGVVMYTSGTTGTPKGCMLRNGALLRNASGMAHAYSLAPEDRVWVTGTLFHMMGLQPLLSCALRGATFVGIRYWSVDEAVERIAAEKCTIAVAIRDSDWLPLVDHVEFNGKALTGLRYLSVVGLEDALTHIQDQMPHTKLRGEWGCTEATGLMAMASPNDPLLARIATGGHPFEGNALTVVDDDGNELPPGEVGEIVYEGYCVFAGYYKDPELTREVILPDGRFRPGDLASLDAEGRPSFAGTKKGMIRVGGENVSYLEVENFLATHPAVRMACVIGVRDSRYGQVPAAYVELAAGHTITERELIEFGLDRIATFKIPRYIRFLTEWPMSSTKISRKTLEEWLTAELDTAEVAEAPMLVSATRSQAR
jgi:fatty-acyl-CoA synthase